MGLGAQPGGTWSCLGGRGRRRGQAFLVGVRSAQQGRVYPGPRPLRPDLLSGECDHVQGPVHEAPVQHLRAALAHHRVTRPVVGSDVLAGRDCVSRQPGGQRGRGRRCPGTGGRLGAGPGGGRGGALLPTPVAVARGAGPSPDAMQRVLRAGRAREDLDAAGGGRDQRLPGAGPERKEGVQVLRGRGRGGRAALRRGQGRGTYSDLDLRAFALPLLPGEGRAVDGGLLALGQLWSLFLDHLRRPRQGHVNGRPGAAPPWPCPSAGCGSPSLPHSHLPPHIPGPTWRRMKATTSADSQ